MCEICLEYKSGTRFTRLECSHVCCTDCLACMANIHVTAGVLLVFRVLGFGVRFPYSEP